jgi:hypothetical protein
MKPISKLRFDSLAGYSREWWTRFVVRELGWFEAGNEKVLGMVSFDRSDEDYAWYVLGRDGKGRFRSVSVDCSIPDEQHALRMLEEAMDQFAQLPAEEFYQGDEVSKPVDFFTPVVPLERQHENFRVLRSGVGYSPALGLLSEMAHYFEDADGNFVQQFQSVGFDARLWELYLYAVFTELGFGLVRDQQTPDFHLQSPFGEFLVEATTVNPSASPPAESEQESKEYFENYLPIKFGSALCSKLAGKSWGKYWDLPHVAGHPLVFAIQDFQKLRSMSWSNTALVEYLYGIRQLERKDDNGESMIISEPITNFTWKEKTIEAGFFLLPDSENVSAVFANPGGTISKFNRMGFLAGFGDRHVRMVRKASGYKSGSLIPQDFVREVHAPDYSETWCEGLSIYHNPNAKYPLPRTVFPCAANFISRDGRIVSRLPEFYPVGSITAIITPQSKGE